MEDKKVLTYEELMSAMSEFHKSMSELREQQKENIKNIAYLFELQKKFQEDDDKRMAKLEKKIDKMADEVKRLNRTVCGVEKSNGMVAEEYFFNSLNATKTFGGISFDKIDRNMYDTDFDSGEYDIVMINGNCIGIIETKYRVRTDDVSKLAKKQAKRFKNLFPQYSAYDIYLGIGGMSFTCGVEKKAGELGVGILKLKGDVVEIYDKNLKAYR
jgi:hypothetical protein